MYAKLVAELVLVLLLVGSLVHAQDDLPIRINITTVSGDGMNTCPPNDQLEEARNAIDRDLLVVIQSISQKSLCNCGGPGWTQVANLDMTDPNQQCPSGFRLVTSPRSCGRPANVVGCISTTFPVHGVEYSSVCGRVIGYQDQSPDAFISYFSNRALTIDDNYVDGISLTHGSSPRNHIWTFAGALDETRSSVHVCPCTRPDLTYAGVVPPFVGQDYFCETASRNPFQHIFYPDDPLWDGQGCGAVSTCCDHPLYFCKQLPQPTSDDIELRVCHDSTIGDEDTPLEIVEIYVQ